MAGPINEINLVKGIENTFQQILEIATSKRSMYILVRNFILRKLYLVRKLLYVQNYKQVYVLGRH